MAERDPLAATVPAASHAVGVREPDFPQRNFGRVRPKMTQRVRIAPRNLLNEHGSAVPQFSRKLDFVFCRNDRIDFDRPTQVRILGRIVRILRPGGLLFVGHGESFAQCSPDLALQGKAVCQRTNRAQDLLACAQQNHRRRRPSGGER